MALFASYSYHGFIDLNRRRDDLPAGYWSADHRLTTPRLLNAIRDLKHGVGLNHLPSGRFDRQRLSWLAVQVLAHNLARWTVRSIRVWFEGVRLTTKTLRRRFFSLSRTAHRAGDRPAWANSSQGW